MTNEERAELELENKKLREMIQSFIMETIRSLKRKMKWEKRRKDMKMLVKIEAIHEENKKIAEFEDKFMEMPHGAKLKVAFSCMLNVVESYCAIAHKSGTDNIEGHIASMADQVLEVFRAEIHRELHERKEEFKTRERPPLVNPSHYSIPFYWTEEQLQRMKEKDDDVNRC